MSLETVRDIAIIALVAWCFWWIIRDDQRVKRENKAAEPFVPVPGSDTPIHDHLATQRHRADLDKWGAA